MSVVRHLLLCAGAAALSAAGAPLSLDEAVALALRHSRAAQLAQLKVDEASAGVDAAEAQRYPQASAVGLAGYTPRSYEINLPAGSLTPLVNAFGAQLGIPSGSSLLGAFPPDDTTLVRGRRELYIGGVGIVEPISLQWRIASGVAAARAARIAAQRDAAEVAGQIRYSVENLFAGIAVEQRRHEARAARLALQEARLRDAENARQVDEVLDDAVIGLRAELIEAQAEATRGEQQRVRLTLQLADLIGQPGAQEIAVAPGLPRREAHSLEYWLGRVERNPSRQVAAALADQAAAAVRAARQEYIPDVSFFALAYAQDGQDLLPRESGLVGVTLKWDIFDFGRRKAEIGRNLARNRAAETNRDRLEEEAAREIRTSYLDLVYAEKLAELARQSCDYRRRSAELARQSVANDLALPSKGLAADAALRQAEADLFAADVQTHLALLRLYWLSGDL